MANVSMIEGVKGGHNDILIDYEIPRCTSDQLPPLNISWMMGK